MSETETFVGKNEKEVVESAVRYFGGVLKYLPRKTIVGSREAVDAFTAILAEALEIRIKAQRAEAEENINFLRSRGLSWNRAEVFATADEAERHLSSFRSRLEAARAADQKWKAEQDAKKAAAQAEAPAVEPKTGTE